MTPQKRPGPALRARFLASPEDLQKHGWPDNPDPSVGFDREEILVAAHHVASPALDRGCEKLVIVGVTSSLLPWPLPQQEGSPGRALRGVR